MRTLQTLVGRTAAHRASRRLLTWALAALVLPTAGAPGVFEAHASNTFGKAAPAGRNGRPGPLTPSANARLEAITTRADGTTLAVLLEVSKPVAYAASQPDPLTVLVELRGVTAAGVQNQLSAGRHHPIAALTVEQAKGPDGVTTARVRLRLAEAVPFRVRSARNVIRVEMECSAANANPENPKVPPPSTSVAVETSEPRIPIPESPSLPAPPAVTPPSPAGDPATAGSHVNTAPPAATAPSPAGNPANAGPQVNAAPAPVKAQAPPAATTNGQVLPGGAPKAKSAAPRLPVPPSGDAAQPSPVATEQEQAPVPPPPVPQGPPPAAPPATQGGSTSQSPPPSALTGSAIQGGQKQYTGNTISMDFGPAADLRAVLRVFGDQFGLNLLIDPGVKGTVDVQLRDVPWDQALDIILRSNQLGWTKDGNIVRIAPLTVLAEEEASRRKLAEEQALGGELDMITRTLSYAKAEEMKALLERGALTKRGQAQVDTRTNTLIIRDLPVGITNAVQVMETLDQAQPQVEIEARIVQTTSTFARQLGAQLGVYGRATPELGNTFPFAFPNSGSISGRTGAAQGPGGTPSAVNLPANPVTSALGIALGSINGALTLDAALSALEKQGKGRVLSTPRVFAQNNIPAEITQGVQIPIQTVANNTVTVTFKDAALTMKVTPQINANGTVIMQITVENASPDYSNKINNIPPIDTQRAVTQVMVKDGQTAVVGGIYMSQEQVQKEQTPGLGKIPVLGWLFKRDTIDEQSRELLIFITPKIVKA